MPLAECPTCGYRSAVRTENLSTYAQCLRCTARFIPVPAQPPRWGRVLAAMAGAVAVSLAAVTWLMLRSP